MHTTLRATVAAVFTVAVLAGCAVGGSTMHKDAAGLTQSDVAGLTLRQEYDRFRARYEHMQDLLKGAQLQVYDGEWQWNGGDDLPIAGGNGVAPLPGSDTENSYDMTTSRMWTPPGARGDRRDLEPMIRYFSDQGWDVYERTLGDDHDVRGVTGDGWQLFYTVQTNGRYALDVSSEPFWTNDSLALSTAVFGRSTMTSPPPSRPGIYPPFPTWDAPIVNHPKI